MKLVKLLSLFVVTALVFASCNPETVEPTINWEGNLSKTMDFAIETTYDIDIDVAVEAEAGIKTFIINKNVYTGDTFTTVELTAPTAFVDETSFTHNFMYTITEADFPADVTSVVFEFVVTDNEDRPITKEFTVLTVGYLTLTFTVEDADGVAITDAIVTFDGTALDAGTYVVENVDAGTYDYSVEKAGYETVTVTDYEATMDETIDVVLEMSLAAFSADLPLALYGQTTWASYEGTAVTNYYSNMIGVSFNYTDGTTVRIEDTDYTGGAIGCDGWVVVADIATLTSQTALVDAYAAGTVVHEYDLPYDQHKTYAPVYFISKMGTTYKLVYYVAGHRDGTTGNVVVFQYK